jgi:acetylornithine/succinyldiaminopimelate/putrescine aminotransferase
LFDEAGRSYIDLFTAHGTSWLGHCNRAVTAAVAGQLQKLWITGGLETAVYAKAKALIESFFPPSHGLAALYSTGMEAAEFALRIARVVTGRNGAVGFARSMHGKSLATALLGWDNRDGLRLPGFYLVPFLPECSEGEILGRLTEVLQSGRIAAVFVEPILGSGGGQAASEHFHRQVANLCSHHGALLVFDEILTGFYRTGNAFYFSGLGFTPDIVLIGKAMGNGFPVSGVVVTKKYPIRRQMLPGSTFSGNPLAAAAVLATLRHLRALDMPKLVARIEIAIMKALGPLTEIGVAVRGKGALWILELPADLDVEEVVRNVYRRGVSVGHTASQLRVLPPATIRKAHLGRACAFIREEVLRAHHDHRFRA